MAYDTLVKEAKDLPEEMIEQIIEFMRFLKYTSKKEQIKQSISNTITFHRSVNPLSDEFIAIAENLVIITKDGTIPQYNVKVLW